MSAEAADYLSRTPPRCLAALRPVLVRADVESAVWRLRCPCGSEVGSVLGHPLGGLEPEFQNSDLMVSPFRFRCGGCGSECGFFDSDEHGEGPEFARQDGSGEGGRAYRGEGEPVPSACPKCGGVSAVADAVFTFHDERLEDWEADLAFPLADFFDWFRLSCTCADCGHVREVTEIDTKP